MQYLKLFQLFLLEKRNLEEREKVSVSHRIVDFLNKYNYKYGGSDKDSPYLFLLRQVISRLLYHQNHWVENNIQVLKVFIVLI